MIKLAPEQDYSLPFTSLQLIQIIALAIIGAQAEVNRLVGEGEYEDANLNLMLLKRLIAFEDTYKF